MINQAECSIQKRGLETEEWEGAKNREGNRCWNDGGGSVILPGVPRL